VLAPKRLLTPFSGPDTFFRPPFSGHPKRLLTPFPAHLFRPDEEGSHDHGEPQQAAGAEAEAWEPLFARCGIAVHDQIEYLGGNRVRPQFLTLDEAI
jgi:hypothetical protein